VLEISTLGIVKLKKETQVAVSKKLKILPITLSG
jgi:hypothetical protein